MGRHVGGSNFVDQISLSRLAGSDEALQRCLIELAAMYGRDARARLKAIRDELILRFENASIVPDEPNRVIEPAIAVIEADFDEYV